MRILFLTTVRISDIEEKGIYQDLIRTFRNNGHQMYVACPNERRYKSGTRLIEKDNVNILLIGTLNMQKTNIIEKGISLILFQKQFITAINKYFKDLKFDLIIYSTPPITFCNVIEYFKRKSKAKTYLLLKDIFPQNAVDLGLLKKNSLIYKYFLNKEKKLYHISDYIGCMSQANVEYLIRHYPNMRSSIVEVNPNCIEIPFNTRAQTDKEALRLKFNLPLFKTIFIYGGNLGKPQGVDFIIKCLEANKQKTNAFFLIVGAGTEYRKLENWFILHNPPNIRLITSLPKIEYDELLTVCDIGLIFLDFRFTIPNFPSRMLSYLENKMPILSATDEATDIGSIAVQNGFGLSCKSNNVQKFSDLIDYFLNNKSVINEMGSNGYEYLKNNYTAKISYDCIMKHFD
ncbi:glycosyltransferase family 4 protein [Arachidicoccus sp.]|uniref:glycosyltransferase family 4 protein n=1 Tax=Arachidicoccus sp. TaxID=1872624 RepID=UPI003D1DD073